jgi:hypothetical protein
MMVCGCEYVEFFIFFKLKLKIEKKIINEWLVGGKVGCFEEGINEDK